MGPTGSPPRSPSTPTTWPPRSGRPTSDLDAGGGRARAGVHAGQPHAGEPRPGLRAGAAAARGRGRLPAHRGLRREDRHTESMIAQPASRASRAGSWTRIRPRRTSIRPSSTRRRSAWLTEGRAPPTSWLSSSWVSGIGHVAGGRRVDVRERAQPADDATLEAVVHRLHELRGELVDPPGQDAVNQLLEPGVALAQVAEDGGRDAQRADRLERDDARRTPGVARGRAARPRRSGSRAEDVDDRALAGGRRDPHRGAPVEHDVERVRDVALLHEHVASRVGVDLAGPEQELRVRRRARTGAPSAPSRGQSTSAPAAEAFVSPRWPTVVGTVPA